MTCYCKLIRYAELILRRNCPGFEPDTSGRTVTHLARACICRLPSSASFRPKMSAPELPEELAGHLAVLMDKSDAYAKARAATAIASGKAHLAAVMGSALSRRLESETDWDPADFIKSHGAVGEFCQNWEIQPTKSLLKCIRTVSEGIVNRLLESIEKAYTEYASEYYSKHPSEEAGSRYLPSGMHPLGPTPSRGKHHTPIQTAYRMCRMLV